MQQRNFVINDGLAGVFKQTIALKLSTTVVQLIIDSQMSAQCTVVIVLPVPFLLYWYKQNNATSSIKILLDVAYLVECWAHFTE
jgi:hypothetical protein